MNPINIIIAILIIVCAGQAGKWVRLDFTYNETTKVVLLLLGWTIVFSTIYIVYQFAILVEYWWPVIYTSMGGT